MKVARNPPLATRSARKPRRLRLMRSSWIKLIGIAIDPRARDVGAVISVSDFDAKRGFMVRSERQQPLPHAAASALAAFAARVPGAINEIRRALGTIEPFLDRSTGGLGQHEWVAELAGRVVPTPGDVSVVCALDTGVAAEHPLVAPGLKGVWAYDAAWGTDDHAPNGGHGTGIAGLVLYGDLLTQGAVAQVEIERPGRTRAFCLATSATDFSPSRPSTWSGALDQIAAGSMPGDTAEGVPASEAPKRLIVAATGNVPGGATASSRRVTVARRQPAKPLRPNSLRSSS
jgi:Subtilase family